MEGLAKGRKSKMGKDAIAEMVGYMFMSRDFAHKAHLKTSSYAEHEALNGFYDAIVDFADGLAEVAQGMYGKLDIPEVKMVGDVKKPIPGLEVHMKDLMDLGAGCKNGALNGIKDEIEGCYLKTLYLLRELS
jgi:hypothetical protein